MTAITTPFIAFDFDKEVQTLWRSMATAGKNFAYHARLASLIRAEASFKVNLDSLKVLDVLLSAIKSDLAGKHVSEGRVLAHDDFARLMVVLLYHVVAVISREVATLNPKPTLSLHTSQGFSRVYARLFAGMNTNTPSTLTDEELDGFYYGMGVLCQGVGVAGQAVADRLFVLPIIGARLFGTIDRTFVAGLDNHGQGHGVAEDSLYWAVHDFIERFKNLQNSPTANDSAKVLFNEQAFSLNQPTASPANEPMEGRSDDMVDNVVPQNPAEQTANMSNEVVQHEATQHEPLTHAVQALPHQPAQNPSHQANVSLDKTAQTTHQVSADLVSNQTPSNSTSQTPPQANSVATQVSPSVHKQRAKASHTPKLFDEAYRDLVNISQPADMTGEYQQAVAVLNKFDAFIDGELAKGKSMVDLTFNDKQKLAQKQALGLLVNLVKQGNPSAMFCLALCYFRGRGVGVDNARAVMLTKRSAEMGDIRAQKLLSRLYYQGYEPSSGGVAMDMNMGEYWLFKSADGGHPEAKKVRAYMNQIEMLKSDYRTERVSDERYALFFKALAVGTVLLFIILSIMW